MLEIINLNKRYNNGVKAINKVTIKINTGMFGLLGPNGAEKSSLMRTIATLQNPDNGSIFFNEVNILNNKRFFRKQLGYLPQSFGVYPKMSAEELLIYFAKLKNISSAKDRAKLIDYVLDITNLTNDRFKNVADYSRGMKQRFGIAQLLLNNPKLIIVDEPTAGLDPAERHRFLNVLREIGTNCTIIFSTHIVDDVKDLCNDIAILINGKISMHKAPKEAIQQYQNNVWTKIIQQDEMVDCSAKYNVLSSSYNDDHSLTVRIYNKEPQIGFTTANTQLDDVYFIALKNEKKTTIKTAN